MYLVIVSHLKLYFKGGPMNITDIGVGKYWFFNISPRSWES